MVTIKDIANITGVSPTVNIRKSAAFMISWKHMAITAASRKES